MLCGFQGSTGGWGGALPRTAGDTMPRTPGKKCFVPIETPKYHPLDMVLEGIPVLLYEDVVQPAGGAVLSKVKSITFFRHTVVSLSYRCNNEGIESSINAATQHLSSIQHANFSNLYMSS